MNFLRQHFEKLILGIVLTALVIGIIVVLLGIGKARGTVAEQRKKAEKALRSGKDLAPDQARDLNLANEALVAPGNRFAFLAAEGDRRGSLLEPLPYLRCVNPRCNYLIPPDELVCRFCNAEQPPEKKDVYPEVEDRDRDGIPNYVEKHIPFLNPEDVGDAGLDYDLDTFTNLEEFRHDTNLANPASYPPLAVNLRLLDKPFNAPLPVVLRGIAANNSDDPAKWLLNFNVFNPQTRRFVLARFRVGETIPFLSDGIRRYGPFVVASARRERRQAGEETKEIGIAVLTWNEQDYTLVEGETPRDLALSASLLFLASRSRSDEAALRAQMRYTPRQDEVFFLIHRPSQRREGYNVVSIAEDKVVVELVQGGAGGMDTGGGMGMDMGGGMGMEMGGGMDMGGGTRPGMQTGTAAAAEPLRFEITRTFDPAADLIDPARLRMPQPGVRVPGQR
ncbi:MAG: hypothetical protein RBU25_13665 [Lentisphaeria bacterium]|nr:hypothetical protein [Lentisphaeria bacterium]